MNIALKPMHIKVKSLAMLSITLLCVLINAAGLRAQESSIEGTWVLEEDQGDFVEIKKTNEDYVFVRIAFNSAYQSVETERYPAFSEGSSLSVRVRGGSMPALYEQDTDTLTIDGRKTYRRMSGSIEEASEQWMAARDTRLAENKRLCEELKSEQSARSKEARKDPDTWTEFKAEMKARSPKGCLMPLLF